MVVSDSRVDSNLRRVVIRPNRSLSWRQSMIFMGAIAVPTLLVSIVLAVKGGLGQVHISRDEIVSQTLLPLPGLPAELAARIEEARAARSADQLIALAQEVELKADPCVAADLYLEALQESLPQVGRILVVDDSLEGMLPVLDLQGKKLAVSGGGG